MKKILIIILLFTACAKDKTVQPQKTGKVTFYIKLIDNSGAAGSAKFVNINQLPKVEITPDIKAQLLQITKRYYDEGKMTKEQYDEFIK